MDNLIAFGKNTLLCFFFQWRINCGLLCLSHRMDSISRLSKKKIFRNLDNVRALITTIAFGKKSFGIREIHFSLRLKKFSSVKKCRVAVVGVGGVGQSLAHLLKMYPAGLTELRLCNRSDPAGIVEELTHIPTGVKVLGFKGCEKMAEGLRDAEIVVVSAGIPRKKTTPRSQLFLENAQLCKEIITRVSENCPDALIAILSNPLNSLVPIAAEVLKKCGTYHPAKLFGICELDSMRSRHYYAEMINHESKKTYVPVVGGHSEDTTVPLFSQARPRVCLSEEKIFELITNVRHAGERVVAKKGIGGSTWSMAAGAHKFVHQLCRAIDHEPHVITSAYVESDVTDASFFSNQLLLGPEGIEKNFGYGDVTKMEAELIKKAVKNLQNNISLAEDFVKNNKSHDNNDECSHK